MATNKTLRIKLARAQAQASRSGRVILGTELVLSAAQAASYFMLCAVLAGGEIFGSCSPFALALVGGAGSGANAAAALGGACLGYLTLLGLVDGLRYVSAAILTFSIAFAFYDTRLYRTPWAMPAATAAMNACTGFIYLSQTGWSSQNVIFFSLEVLLTALCTYAFRKALTPEKGSSSLSRRCCILLLMAAVLICLSGLQLFARVSLGRILAGVAILACARQGGAGAGAAVGVALGLAADLAAGVPLYTISFGIAGTVAGLLRSSRRIITTAAFILSGALSVLWLWSSGLNLALLAELPAVGLLFLLLPTPFLRRLSAQLLQEESATTDERTTDYVRTRLESTAHAFRVLHESLRGAFAHPSAHPDDTAAVFDRAADRVCRSCQLRGTCWERDYVTTFNALNDATQTMLDRGRGEATDFPNYFSSRCIRFPAFLSAVNEELTTLLCRRQYAARIQDSRHTLCQQYGQLSDILSAAAAELGQELTPDPIRQRKLRQHLALLGLEAETAVFYDREQHLRVRLCGPACRQLSQPEQLRSLADLMGMPMTPELEDETHLTLAQSEPFMAIAGIAARRKDGQTVSGDAGTWFKRADGHLYVLLCDGMGSGSAANRESGLAVRLLEQFLKAGVETEQALVILNSALSLRSEEEGGFTTVDLLELDLFTGQGEIYKFGAAPTYIKKQNGVQRITGCSLPAGVATQGNIRPDRTRIKLNTEDCVLMVSDGICSGNDDHWLRERLASFAGDSPKELAAALIADGTEEGATDDRTALVVKVIRRPSRP